ncbi:uncharacterized protein A1O5_06215 [Cladophialophora psammophila CBS 110553]|uniref:Xylanolytic transcriptional activator regulatory domain-containing protein n=1 Tax=Cladophialophora psammophila CBS 110553 TaxID=1182543 RepID=W9WPM6_9EURO|nr:uncharacterized protein A1O5_06215 [Cladophialophora psammophila CBS 110553]EXJ70147.1 hypothetical protein A1O5_06215 [Cladophialophora psammophila CBS 110553]
MVLRHAAQVHPTTTSLAVEDPRTYTQFEDLTAGSESSLDRQDRMRGSGETNADHWPPDRDRDTFERPSAGQREDNPSRVVDAQRRISHNGVVVDKLQTSVRRDSSHLSTKLQHTERWLIIPQFLDYSNAESSAQDIVDRVMMYHNPNSNQSSEHDLVPDLDADISGFTTFLPFGVDFFPVTSNLDCFVTEPALRPALKWRNGTRRQPSPYSPLSSSPLSSCLNTWSNNINIEILVNAYRQYFVPNLPLLHLPTLDLTSAMSDAFRHPVLEEWPPPALLSGRRRIRRPLLLSILALGAAFSGQITLAREIYRQTSAAITSELKSVCKSSVGAAPIPLMQALLQHLVCGTFFGDRVLNETTKNSCVSLLALIKEAGIHTLRDPPNADTRAGVEVGQRGKWLIWVHQEERNRLFFSTLWLMSAFMIYFNDIPHPPLTGVELCLPCKEALWEASDAHTWSEVESHLSPTPLLFVEQIRGLFDQNSPLQPTYTDVDLGNDTNFHEQALEIRQQNTAASHDIGEFGCLSLISVLHICVLAQTQGQNPLFAEVVVPSDRRSLKSAVRRWQRLWLSFSKQPSFGTSYRLLMSCIPLLDHVNLSFRLDDRPLKEAIFTQDFSSANLVFLRDHRDSLDSTAEMSGDRVHSLRDVSETLQRGRFSYEATLYASNALETTLRLSPWWTSPEEASHMPLHSAMNVFDCLQVLASWVSGMQPQQGLEAYDARLDGELCTEEFWTIIQTCRRLIRKCRSNMGLVGSCAAAEAPVKGFRDATHIVIALLQTYARFLLEYSSLWPGSSPLPLFSLVLSLIFNFSNIRILLLLSLEQFGRMLAISSDSHVSAD